MPLRDWRHRFPLTVAPVNLAVPSSPLLPDSHRVRSEVDAEACVADEQRGTRPATGHDIAIELCGEPMGTERERNGAERVPKSGIMPNSQVFSPELSELWRI